MKKIANFLIVEKNNDVYTLRMSAEYQDDIGTVGYAKILVNDKIKKDEIIVKAEASKAIVHIKSPLSGTISQINEGIISTPKMLSSSNEDENWIIKLTDVNEDEFNALEDY